MMEPAPSRWLAGRLLCLLGSVLALGAFFLPTFGGPDGSGWQVMLIGLGFSGQERDVIWLSFALLAVGYLLGVASLLLLALWITFRPPDRIVLTCCFAITVAALSIYVVSTVAQILSQTWTQTVRAALLPSAFPAFLLPSRKLWEQMLSLRAGRLGRAPC